MSLISIFSIGFLILNSYIHTMNPKNEQAPHGIIKKTSRHNNNNNEILSDTNSQKIQYLKQNKGDTGNNEITENYELHLQIDQSESSLKSNQSDIKDKIDIFATSHKAKHINKSNPINRSSVLQDNFEKNKNIASPPRSFSLKKADFNIPHKLLKKKNFYKSPRINKKNSSRSNKTLAELIESPSRNAAFFSKRITQAYMDKFCANINEEIAYYSDSNNNKQSPSDNAVFEFPENVSHKLKDLQTTIILKEINARSHISKKFNTFNNKIDKAIIIIENKIENSKKDTEKLIETKTEYLKNIMKKVFWGLTITFWTGMGAIVGGNKLIEYINEQ